MVFIFTLSALIPNPLLAIDDVEFTFAKRIGGTSGDFANSITVDADGNIYTTGSFQGTVDFDPGAGTSNLVSAGSSDIFVSKLDSSGNFVWAKQIGGTSGDSANYITVDTGGNVYTIGTFQGTADFDPGAGTSNLVSAGSNDIFVSKLDSSGNFVWAKKMGDIGVDFGFFIAVDTDGNVHTTGYFTSTVDFDPGAGTSNLVSAGSADIFISKLDSSGNFVWAKKMGGTGNDSGNSIIINADGNIYTTGYFNGTADFDPGAGTSNLVSAGAQDIFISKLDSSGNFVWVKQMGGALDQVADSIAVDTDGNIYTTGYFNGTADFDPGAGTSNLVSAGSNDIFVSKLDSSGNFVWAKKMGGTSSDLPYSIAVDTNGSVYTTGSFYDTVDFDPGAETSNLVSAGSSDIFVSKLDSSGNFVWVKQMGGTSSDSATEIVLDTAANVYTTGYFIGTADFDPGAGTSNLVSAGSGDIFVSKLSSLADSTPPTIDTLNPTDDATDVSPTANLIITFDEAVNAGAGIDNNIVIYTTSDDSIFETIDAEDAKVTGGGTDIITINPAGTFTEQTGYYVKVGVDAFNDIADNSFAGIDDNTTWNFTVGDFTDPMVSTYSPLDDAIGVTVNTNLVITFDEAVDAGVGNIIIKKSSDDSTVDTIAVGSVLGSGTDIITIDPASALLHSTSYYVNIATNVFNDINGNPYAGISDNTTWNFTTEDDTSTTSTSGSRANNKSFFIINTDDTHTISVSDVCRTGDNFSITTGEPCSNKNASITSTNDSNDSSQKCNLYRVLRLGDRGQDVRCLQQFLQINADGIFGPITKTTVMSFQNLNNLLQDGIVGPKTRIAIGK